MTKEETVLKLCKGIANDIPFATEPQLDELTSKLGPIASKFAEDTELNAVGHLTNLGFTVVKKEV